MDFYEIRIVANSAMRALSSIHASDFAAVRRAKALAKEREGVEVWRAETCVYARPQPDTCHGDV